MLPQPFASWARYPPRRVPALRTPQPRRSKRLAEEIANTRFERILGNASQLSLVFIGAAALFVVLHLGQVILAPVFLAVTIGLMFGPVADALERRGVPDAVSAGVVVLAFLALIASSALLFAVPLAEWIDRVPVVWEALKHELANWQDAITALTSIQEQIKTILGQGGSLEVTVEDSTTVLNIASLAPTMLAEVLVFLASLYFFMATRDQIRIATLSLCVTRRMRWRTAHIFRDVEQKVSKFLITVSLINIGIGVATAVIMTLLGMPTPILWGALAAVLNFVPFVGQAVMVLLLFVVGLSEQMGLVGSLLPVGLYLLLGFVEGNFVTPQLLGRAVTMNPFLIFLSITYWLWAWGPVGGLIAVPSLLILYSIAANILPVRGPAPLPNVAKAIENEAKAVAEEAKVVANEAAAVEHKAAQVKDSAGGTMAPKARSAPRPRKPVPAKQGS
jgi:predicted PurR-regulated permease PerM